MKKTKITLLACFLMATIGLAGCFGETEGSSSDILDESSSSSVIDNSEDISDDTSSDSSTEHTHEYVLQEKVDATCMAEGVEAHYLCDGCGKLFVKEGDTYTETTADALKIAIADHAVTGIEVVTQPTKTVYGAYETFATEGMVVKAVCSTEGCDGVTLDNEAIEIVYQTEGATALKVGDTKVTLKYGDYSAEIAVSVEATTVAKPIADETVFTYTGEEQTYGIAESAQYTITGNKQTNAGEYSVTVSLVDKEACRWEDGTTDDLTFAFNIGQATNAITALTCEEILCHGTPAPQVSASFGADTVVYTVAADGTTEFTALQETTFTAGKYILKATIAGTDNYTAAEQTVEFDVKHEMAWSEDNSVYGCVCGVKEKARYTMSAKFTVEDGEPMQMADGTEIVFAHEDGSEEKVVVSEGNIVVVVKNGTYTVSANYHNSIQLTVEDFVVTETEIVMARQTAEKTFTVSLGNNASADTLNLTFTNNVVEDATETAVVTDGKVTKTVIVGAEYTITSEIFGAKVSIGSVTIGENAEYALTATDFTNSTLAGSTGEYFDAETMSVTFVGPVANKGFLVQGQNFTGEHWFGFKFSSQVYSGGTHYYINDGDMGIYVYFTATGNQLATRIATGENGWTEYQVNGEFFGYPGIKDPYVFIKRHNDNGKLAYTIYQSATLSLEGAWSYTCTTGITYDENSGISVFGINSDYGDFGAGCKYKNMFNASSQEALFAHYSNMVENKTFNVSVGNNANANGLVLTFTNKNDESDVRTATVENGTVTMSTTVDDEGKTYAVTSEIFGAPVSFGDVTITSSETYSLAVSGLHNNNNANATFNAADMSLSYTGNAAGSQFFVQNQAIKGEYWFGFKFKRNATDGVLSTFLYINEGNLQAYIYLVSIPGQLAVRVSTGENGWTDYKVNGEMFGYPGINDPYVFIRRHNDNGKVAYTIYMSATPTLDGAWSYTCTTGVAYSEDSAIGQFGFNAEANYAEGVVISNIYSADSSEKLLKKYL